MDDHQPECLARVRQHDVAALGEYLLSQRPGLQAFIDRHLGAALRRKVDADDIYQEVSIEAVRSLPEADFSQREPFSWLCHIAEHRIIDAHRRYFGAQKRDAAREVSLGTPGGDTQHAALVDLLVASMTTPTQAFSRGQREFRLAEALRTLPQDQRDVIRLRYVEGLASKEIAARLQKSDGAVRVMLTRALGRLQDVLGPQEESG